MVDLNVLSQILSIRNGVWTLVVLFVLALFRGWSGLPAVMEQWVARRRAIAEEKAADWARLRDEVKRLAGAETECRDRLNDALRRLAELEGFMMGQGKARQDAANIVAIERLTDKRGEEGK